MTYPAPATLGITPAFPTDLNGVPLQPGQQVVWAREGAHMCMGKVRRITPCQLHVEYEDKYPGWGAPRTGIQRISWPGYKDGCVTRIYVVNP